MKRLIPAAGLVGVVAAAVLTLWSPVAGSQTNDVRVTCKTRGVDIYFWPHGHRFVSAYKFPKYGPPHIEVYRKGSFASRSFFLFVSAVSYNYANTCELATNPLPTKWGGGPKKTITATRRVRCTLPNLAQLKVIPQGGSGGGGLRVLRASSPSEVLRASVKTKATGSSLTYDTRFCTVSAVPGVK